MQTDRQPDSKRVGAQAVGSGRFRGGRLRENTHTHTHTHNALAVGSGRFPGGGLRENTHAQCPGGRLRENTHTHNALAVGSGRTHTENALAVGSGGNMHSVTLYTLREHEHSESTMHNYNWETSSHGS